jgi:MoxR-like ATPase
VWCPIEHLSIVAAGNFGRAYAVSDLDPAVRRRFDTVIEFDYLDHDAELELVVHESGLARLVADYLVKVAAETRRMLGNAELPGCIDTASLLNWARKCARAKAKTVGDVMKQAQLTWADLACGRDHTGRVNQANFQALADYLKSLGGLPA